MEKDKLRLKYFLNGNAASIRLANLYYLLSRYGNQLEPEDNENIASIAKTFINFLIMKDIFKDEKELLSSVIKGNIEFDEKRKKRIFETIVKSFNFLLMFHNNKELFEKNSLRNFFKTYKISKMEVVILNRTISRQTRTWLGKNHVDLLIASFYKEKLFLTKTTKEDADKFSPLFLRKSYNLQYGKKYEQKDCYGLFENTQVFPSFNRLRFKRNTKVSKKDIDIEKLHFLLKPIEDVNSMVLSNNISEFLVGLDGSLVNLSLTPAYVEIESPSDVQGCIDVVISDKFTKRTAKYFSENIDVSSIKKENYYLLAMTNPWGFEESIIDFAVPITEKIFRLYVAFSYLVNRRKVARDEFLKILEHTRVSLDDIMKDEIMNRFVFLEKDFVYYVPQPISDCFDFFVKNNFNIQHTLPKILQFFSNNEGILKKYFDGWNTTNFLKIPMDSKNKLFGKLMYGTWLDIISFNEVANFFSNFGYDTITEGDYWIFLKNDEVSICDFKKEEIIGDEKILNILKKLREIPMVAYIGEKSENPIESINFNKLDKFCNLLHLYLSRMESKLFTESNIIETDSKLMRCSQERTARALEKLKKLGFFLPVLNDSKERLIVNPRKRIDFEVYLGIKNDEFYLARIRRCLYVFKVPIVITAASKDRIEPFLNKYLRRFNCQYLNDKAVKVFS